MKIKFKEQKYTCRNCGRTTAASADSICFHYKSIDFKCPFCNTTEEIYAYLELMDFLDIDAMVYGHDELTVHQKMYHKPSCLIIGDKVDEEQSKQILKSADSSFYTDKSCISDDDFEWIKKRNKALHLNTLIDDYGVLARCLSPLVKDELIERHSDYRPLPLKVMTTELSPRSGISNPDSWISKNGFIEYFGKLRVRNILYLDDILLDLILLLNRFPFLRLCITIFDDNQPVLGIDTSQGIKIIKKEDCVKMVENYSLNANNTLSGESRSFSELFSDAEIVKEPLDIDEIANMIGIRGCDLRK